MKNRGFLRTIFQKGRSRNIFVFLCVLGLTALTVKASYAYFFSVKKDSIIEKKENGNLSISYINNSSAIIKKNLIRMSNQDGLEQKESNTLYIQNNGDNNAIFTINVGYNIDAFTSRNEYSVNDRLIPLDYIMLAIYKHIGNEDKLIVGPISVSELPIYEYDINNYLNNRYSLMFGDVGGIKSGDAAKTFKIKSWLSDKAPHAIDNTFFYLDLDVVDESIKSELSYNISGILQYDDMPMENAKISFHNGSLITKTNSEGKWSFNNIYPGIYNIDITIDGIAYSGNITIEKSDSVNEAIILSMGNTTSYGSLWDLAYNYGTTIEKLKVNNSINDYSTNIKPRTYSLMPTYKIVVGRNSEINNVLINIDLDEYTFLMSNG